MDDINSKLKNLNDMVNKARKRQLSWREVWEEVRVTRTWLKETRFPTKSQKDEAIIRLHEFTEGLKRDREESLERQDKFKESSKNILADIVKELYWMEPRGFLDGLGDSIGGIAAGIGGGIAVIPLLPFFPHSALTSATASRESIGDGTTREELDRRNEAKNEAWNIFNSNKGNMTKEDADTAYHALTAAKADLDHSWDERKRALGEQREASIEKAKDFICKSENTISKIEDNIHDLECKIREGGSQKHIERLEGWIDEHQEKISHIREQVRSAEERIDKWSH